MNHMENHCYIGVPLIIIMVLLFYYRYFLKFRLFALIETGGFFFFFLQCGKKLDKFWNSIVMYSLVYDEKLYGYWCVAADPVADVLMNDPPFGVDGFINGTGPKIPGSRRAAHTWLCDGGHETLFSGHRRPVQADDATALRAAWRSARHIWLVPATLRRRRQERIAYVSLQPRDVHATAGPTGVVREGGQRGGRRGRECRLSPKPSEIPFVFPPELNDHRAIFVYTSIFTRSRVPPTDFQWPNMGTPDVRTLRAAAAYGPWFSRRTHATRPAQLYDWCFSNGRKGAWASEVITFELYITYFRWLFQALWSDSVIFRYTH